MTLKTSISCHINWLEVLRSTTLEHTHIYMHTYVHTLRQGQSHDNHTHGDLTGSPTTKWLSDSNNPTSLNWAFAGLKWPGPEEEKMWGKEMQT